MNKKFLKKTLAITTSVATTLSVSGISLLAPIFVANAVTINDGDTIKTATSFDVWIVKKVGTKMFKRLILNPQVFASYGHLSWGAIKTVSSAEAAMYTESKLVRAVGDPKVYELSSAPDSDTGLKKWVNMTAAEFTAAGNDWDSIYEINAVDRDNYTVSTDITPTTVTPTPTPTPTPTTGTGVKVSLASATPVADSVAMGAQDQVFARINFLGLSNTTVSAVSITRGGLANDADLSEVQLWDGATELGSAQALNTTTHKATFSSLSWVVPAGLTKVLTVTGSIAASGTATTSTAPRLGIAAAADITVNTAVSSDSVFPIYSNAMTLAGLAIGRLDFVVRTVPGDLSPVSGSTEQEIASWTLSAVNENMNVKKIRITNIGSAGTADISNIKLKVTGVQIGSTVASLASDGSATFDLTSAPLSILSGSNKIVYAYADITKGINTSRTVRFEVTNATDVTAMGQSTGGSVTITIGSGATFTAQTGVVQTISQGTILTIALNGATSPSAQRFVRGESQVLTSAFRFSNGAGEDQRVTRLKLLLAGTGADATDVSNVTLYKYDETLGTETMIGSPTSFIGLTATFGVNTTPTLDPGLFDVLKSKNVVIHVRVDITSSATWTGDNFDINISEARVDGIQSAADIGAAVITSVDTEAPDHFASSNNGILTWAKSSSSPASQNVVPGTKDFAFGAFDLTMSREGGTMSSLTVNLCDGVCVASTAANGGTGDFTNVKLWNGTTQLGTTVAAPSSSATFNFNLVLAEDKTVTVKVTADVPTDAVAQWAATDQAGVALSATTSAPVATGSSSSASLPAASLPLTDALGNVMTALAETVTVAFQTVPSTTIILNANQATLSKVVLAAGTSGDVKVSSIKFTASSSTTLDAAGNSAADTNFGTLKLFDGATQIGSTLSAFTNVSGGDTAIFSGLSVTIPKGTSKLLELKGNVIAAPSGTFMFVGISDLTDPSDVVATGLSSNTTIYGTATSQNGNSGQITMSGAGSLLVEVDADTPLARYVTVGATAGKTGVEFSKFKFTATNEPIDLERLVVTLDTSNNQGTNTNDISNFASLQLFSGTTAVSNKDYPAGSNAASYATSTFTFSPLLRVAKGGSVVLTLKGDLNGTSNGANSTTTPRFFIVDVTGAIDGVATGITGRGVDSGVQTVVASAGTGTKNPQVSTNVNEVTVVRSKPIFALCTASNCSKATPSGSLVPGVSEVLRFRITAEGDDVIFSGASGTGGHNINFTIAQSGGKTVGNRVMNFYEVGKSAALQTITVVNATGSVDGTAGINVIYATTTIASGTYKEYYLDYDLQDYTVSGNTYRLSIANAATDISWGDGVTGDISIANITDGLPMTGGTLTK